LGVISPANSADAPISDNPISFFIGIRARHNKKKPETYRRIRPQIRHGNEDVQTAPGAESKDLRLADTPAIDAVIIYKHQFLESRLPGASSSPQGLNAKSTLETARQYASLKKYARPTPETLSGVDKPVPPLAQAAGR